MTARSIRAAALALAMVWLAGCGTEATSFDQVPIYDGSPIPTFTAMDAENLAASLAEEEERYGVCFGWSLEDGSTGEIQVGSSRGASIPASQCERYAEVEVRVGYTSEMSEYEDGADVSANASPDLRGADDLVMADFERLGIGPPTLVDDPVSTTGHAALALPLLLVESGDLRPVADNANGRPATGQPGIPQSGAEFPWWTVVALVLCVVAAGAALVAGIYQRRRAGSPHTRPDERGVSTQ